MSYARYYSGLMNPMYESVDREDYVIATYLVGARRNEDPIVKATSIAIEQTTGSWIDVAIETDEVRKKYAGKVFGVYEVPVDICNEFDLQNYKAEIRYYVMRIGFPVVNFKNNLPLMMSAILGNSMSLPRIRCLDIDFPESFVSDFQGPKFGIEGIRDYLGIHGRPILNNMIKPCTGWTPEEGAELFYEAAVGGVDYIKDDELIGGDTSFNKVVDRVKRNMEMAAKADAIKGEKTMYTVNITDEIVNLERNARAALKAGANALMVDVNCVGFSALRMLAENPEINVPIIAHPTGYGAQSASLNNGYNYNVFIKMVRLCGADIQLAINPYGKLDNLKHASVSNINHMRNKFYHIKPSLPMIGGGTVPGNIQTMIEETGIDCIIGAGAAVHGFPEGPRAGAVALRQAIDCAVKGADLKEYAKTHRELELALNIWGVVDAENSVKKNYLI